MSRDILCLTCWFPPCSPKITSGWKHFPTKASNQTNQMVPQSESMKITANWREKSRDKMSNIWLQKLLFNNPEQRQVAQHTHRSTVDAKINESP